MGGKLPPITLRAQYLLLSGIYDWVLARLSQTSFDPIFTQIAEASYCANINKYLVDIEFELDRNDYQGPVNGVLWCSGYSALYTNYRLTALPDDKDDNKYYEEFYPDLFNDDLIFLITLTVHILPEQKINTFKEWLDGVIQRLATFCIPKTESELDDLFGYENDIDWLGDYVAKEILDLTQEYHPEQAIELCDNYLQQVDYQHNPLLLPPDEVPNKVIHPSRLIIDTEE